MADKIMRIGETSGYWYMGFQPPLTHERASDIPLPSTLNGREFYFNAQPDGSNEIAFEEDVFPKDDSFAEFKLYAGQVASHLGDYSLNDTVIILGVGSVIEQARRELE